MATHSGTLAWKLPWMEKPASAYSPWGRKESATTERLHFLFFFSSPVINPWVSLVVQWWRICVRIQGTWVPSQMREDPTWLMNTTLQPLLYNLLLFSRSVVSDSLRPSGLQQAGFSVLHHLLELVQTHVPWVYSLCSTTREAPALGSPPTTTWE